MKYALFLLIAFGALGCSHPVQFDDLDGGNGKTDSPSGSDGSTNNNDSGMKADTGGNNGGPCHMPGNFNPGTPPSCPTPLNTTGWVSPDLAKPVGKHTGQCTQNQLDTYHQCVVSSNMTACMTIQQQAMTTYKTCLACLETTTMDATWGPLVCKDAMTCYLNVEGCMNLALNQSGCSSCGQLLYESYGCQRVACEAQCSGNASGFSQCVSTALAGTCKQYGDSFTNGCGMYSAMTNPDLDNCLRRQGETDSKALRARIDTFMCGN